MSHNITIKISTGNAAFSDGNAEHEIGRILETLAGKLRSYDWELSSMRDGWPLYDVNGNKVGTITAKRKGGGR